MLVKVALRDAVPQYDKIYTYRVPRLLQEQIQPGQRVVVGFGHADRTVEAVVWSLVSPEEEAEQVFRLKEVVDILDPDPVLTADQMQLVTQMRIRYACTYGEAIRCMIPTGVALDLTRYVQLKKDPAAIPVTGRSGHIISRLSCAAGGCVSLKELMAEEDFSETELKELLADGTVEIREDIGAGMGPQTVRTVFPADPAAIAILLEEGGLRYINQIRVLEFLSEYGETAVDDVLHACSVTLSTLNTLRKKGLVDFGKQIITPQAEVPEVPHEGMLVPTSEQQTAIDAILRSVDGASDHRRIREYLLYGITGSGKTEVYLQAAAGALSRNKDVILLVPEISLTPQMVVQLAARFGSQIAILHSRLTPRERFNQWQRIRKGEAHIVVGARSAIFAPVANLGLIIIDEEQESTYQSELKPRYHAATIARLRVRDQAAVLVLGSATPSVETWYRTEIGRSICLRLTKRPGEALLPVTHIIDMKAELAAGNRSWFSRALIEGLKKTFAAGNQAMIFLNRRGYSGLYLCQSCGHAVMCPSCDVRMTLHRMGESHQHRLLCHYCGRVMQPPHRCPACGSRTIGGFGIGTQLVEQELKRLFTDHVMLRMDRDTTTGRTAHHDILRTFRSGEADVLIGTQMIAKGHDFPNVTLVGILSADLLMGQGDFRGAERAFQLITQAAGRAGRKDKPGEVYIQAYDVDHYAVQSAAAQDYGRFYRQEIRFRKQMGYPPFGVIATVVASSSSEADAKRAIRLIERQVGRLQELRPALGAVRMLRPAPAAIRKINRRSRWQLVLKSEEHQPLSFLLNEIALQRLPRGVSLSLRLDPG